MVVKATAIVDRLLEADPDTPETVLPGVYAHIDAARQSEIEVRWKLIGHKKFPKGGQKSKTYVDANGKVYLKLLRDFAKDRAINVYIYSDTGEFVDGEVDAIPLDSKADLHTALEAADRIASEMVKKWSLSRWRYVFT
jgi:hypothetical protein